MTRKNKPNFAKTAEEWEARIAELIQDRKLANDPEKREAEYLVFHEEGRAFLRAELQAGRLHPDLGLWIHLLVSVEPADLQALLPAPKKDIGAFGSLVPLKTPTLPSTGVLSRQIPAPRFHATGMGFASQEYHFIHTVFQVLAGWLPLESQRSRLRRKTAEVRQFYRKYLVATPQIDRFLSAIDGSDLEDLKRLWPGVKQELIRIASQKPAAITDRIGAQVRRIMAEHNEPGGEPPKAKTVLSPKTATPRALRAQNGNHPSTKKRAEKLAALRAIVERALREYPPECKGNDGKNHATKIIELVRYDHPELLPDCYNLPNNAKRWEKDINDVLRDLGRK